MADLYEQLTEPQRRLADSVIIHICRGQYTEALAALRNSCNGPEALPPVQEGILRRIVVRLHNPALQDGTEVLPLVNENNQRLLEQLKDHGVDVTFASTINTNIPVDVLGKIYKQAMNSSFEQFSSHLEHLQYVEHMIVNHNLILYAHCVKLKLAQQAVSQLETNEGVSMELATLYGFVLVLMVILFGMLL
ncbi:hypothetical protein KR018_005813 [Drosophila ironensis]|nr:hypothetical protein KR018_005813 [Drosophila ironensis]